MSIGFKSSPKHLRLHNTKKWREGAEGASKAQLAALAEKAYQKTSKSLLNQGLGIDWDDSSNDGQIVIVDYMNGVKAHEGVIPELRATRVKSLENGRIEVSIAREDEDIESVKIAIQVSRNYLNDDDLESYTDMDILFHITSDLKAMGRGIVFVTQGTEFDAGNRDHQSIVGLTRFSLTPADRASVEKSEEE